MNVLELIKLGTEELKLKKIVSSRLDAEILLSKTLNREREDILINLNQKVCETHLFKYKKLIKRRSRNEPIAYILQEKEFWSKSFFVGPGTLIPRPETELMIEKLVTIFKEKKISVLDLGTGSGCILISLLSELSGSKGTGIDISKEALLVAKINVDKHKMQNNVKLLKKSINSEFKHKFDLVVSNPPYIRSNDIQSLSDDIKKYEPRIALDGGNDGLDLIKKVIYKTQYILKVNGMLALEIGNRQFKKVSKILVSKNFKIEHIIKDYKENVRCIISTYINNK